MTTLEEEDDLFGAHLSMDFEDGATKNRPWQSARPRNDEYHHRYTQNERTSDVYREPYELLDDVPPANIPSQANLIKPRYPVDAYNDRPRVTFRLENDSSPYSIDDYSDVDVVSNYSNGSKMSYDNTYPKYAEDNFITESRSDSEMSTYESMTHYDEKEHHRDDDYECSTHRTSSERNEISRYEYDNNSYDSEDLEFDSTSGGGRSRGSMSTFDRFYHEGDDEGLIDSPGTQQKMPERSAGVSTTQLANKKSLRATISETLQDDSFNFDSTVDRSPPEENAKRREAKIDGSALTPVRSNAWDQASSSRRGESDDIFRAQGADSFSSSPNPSHQSDDSAIQHLADFHKTREISLLGSPSQVLDVEPHPTAHLIASSQKRADPPEEKAAKDEVRYNHRNSVHQEPGGYKQFGLFPDILRDGYPREMEERRNETGDSPQQYDDVLEVNTHGFSKREPAGECYSDMKHKLVQFEDVYEEDEVEKGRHKNSDFDFATDVSFSSSKSSCHEKTKLAVDDISVISEDTDINRLAKQHILRNKDKHTCSMNTYAVKEKDSMESGIKINSEARKLLHSYKSHNKIKQNESIESYKNIDFDDRHLGKKGGEYYHGGMQTANSVVSPPQIKRKEFNFADMEEESSDDSRSCSESSTSTKHYFSDDDSEASSDVSEDDSVDDESGTSDDPSLFPSKAIFQMNLDRNHDRAGGSNISGDLIEKACGLLSRGRNSDALDALTIALNRAENNMNHAKTMLDEHYLSKKRGSNRPGMNAGMNEEAFEDQLDTNFQRAASEMANIMNNIGVVHEMNGDVKKAMNSFREALTVYQGMCHRYENTGDSDVDRTVNNIMQMGIAMRSQQRRMELHSKARKLDKQIHSSDDPSTRLKLSMERLNVLMCIIDVESESLGRNHPSVGFTLMKKGNLHLQLNHIDQAIKDCREAIEILKKGLGHIHPEVGRAMMRLADIFNYHSNGDWESDKDTARSLYQASLTPLRESFGNVNSDLALACNCIGIIYAMKSDTENAMKSFYDALVGYGVRTKADEETSRPVSPDVFFVWINVGDLHSKRSEWQLALRSFQKACTSFRALSDSQKDYLQDIGPRRMMRFATANPKKPFDDNETLLSSVLQNIGKAQCILHKYGKSVETLQEALRIQNIIAMRCCEGRGTNCTRDVARVLGNLGEVQMLGEYIKVSSYGTVSLISFTNFVLMSSKLLFQAEI
jgi:tetratricopeptide (TPR) repeat protein